MSVIFLTNEDMDQIYKDMPSKLSDLENDLEISDNPAIIDVTELPTENIVENTFYRLLKADYVYGQETFNDSSYIMYCVDTLPETGEVVTDASMSFLKFYYSVQNNDVYGYVDDMLAAAFGFPTSGWVEYRTLCAFMNETYGGVITHIDDAKEYSAWYVLLSYSLYTYKEGKWHSIDSIGWRGIGANAEVFNDNKNTAYGDYSHAEGRGEYWIYHITGEVNTKTYTLKSSNLLNNLVIGASVRYEVNNNTFKTAKIVSIDKDNLKITLNRTLSEDTALDNKQVNIYVSGMALGNYSHSEGNETIAAGRSQHTQGEYNIVDPEYDVNDKTKRGKYAHIVGNGSSHTERSNAHTLDWDGNAEYQGDVLANACGGENPISLVETANALDNKITTPSTATVGQVLIVKAVDENGKPTEWETVDKFTEADKTEIKALIKAYVDEAILGGTW